MQPSKDDLTVTEVAALFRVSSLTVRRWLSSKRIKGYQTPGGEWRVPTASLAPAGEQAGA